MKLFVNFFIVSIVFFSQFFVVHSHDHYVDRIPNGLVGTWHGTFQTSHGYLKEWSIVLEGDGTYVSLMEIKDGNKVISKDVEEGRWQLSNDIWATHTLSVKKTSGKVIYPNSYVHYKILDFDKDCFVYKQIRTGQVFKVFRGLIQV